MRIGSWKRLWTYLLNYLLLCSHTHTKTGLHTLHISCAIGHFLYMADFQIKSTGGPVLFFGILSIHPSGPQDKVYQLNWAVETSTGVEHSWSTENLCCLICKLRPFMKRLLKYGKNCMKLLLCLNTLTLLWLRRVLGLWVQKGTWKVFCQYFSSTLQMLFLFLWISMLH